MREMCLQSRKRYSSIIDLPAPECLSIENLQQHRAIASNAKFVLFENKRSNVRPIKSKMTRLGYKGKCEVIEKDFTSISLDGEYDWVNLDTCSSLSMPMLRFISRLKFIPGGDLNVWLTGYRSRNRFLNDLLETFLRCPEGQAITQSAQEQYKSQLKDCDSESLVTVLALILAMRQYTFQLDVPCKYSDTATTMTMFRMWDIRPSTPVWPEFGKIFKSDNPFESLDYESKHDHRASADDPVLDLCLKGIDESDKSLRSFVVRTLRQSLKIAVGNGKGEKWVKAGWKSTISKNVGDPDARNKCHELITNIYVEHSKKL